MNNDSRPMTDIELQQERLAAIEHALAVTERRLRQLLRVYRAECDHYERLQETVAAPVFKK